VFLTIRWRFLWLVRLVRAEHRVLPSLGLHH
jgi:hypothetical protein